MSTCKSCGAPIRWIRTQSGRGMPVDAQGVLYIQTPTGTARVVTSDGQVLSAELTTDSSKATGLGFISHFATCLNADMHRKKAKRAGYKPFTFQVFEDRRDAQ